MSGTRKFGINAWLLGVVIAAALPAIVLAGIMSERLVRAEQAAMVNDLSQRAAAIANVVDRRVQVAIVTTTILAESPRLAHDDLAGFHADAIRIIQRQGVVNNVIIIGRDGRQLLNTRMAFGAELPLAGVNYQDVFNGKRPIVSDLFVGMVSKKQILSIVVPVFRGDDVIYALATGLDPDDLSQLLVEQHLPAGWIGAVVDRQGTIVARTHAPEKFIGSKGAPAFIKAVSTGCHKPYQVVSKEGLQMTGACVTMPQSGWSVAIGAPEEILQQSASDYIRYLFMLSVTLLVFGGFVSLLFASYVSRQVSAVARAARSLGSGGAIGGSGGRISELDDLGQSLMEAKGLIDAREAERAELVQAALTAQAEAETANMAKTNFLAAASHDLRQPFQAMRLFHGVLESRAGPELTRVVDNLGKAMASGEELLSAILDLSVLDTGIVVAQCTYFPVDSVLAEVVNDCSLLAKESRLTIKYVKTNAIVYSDKVLFKRMVRNLAVNAIRYTKEGGILLGCRHRGQKLLVQIVDTGMGIPRDRLALIFQDFYQIGNASRDKTRGLGLGLGIVGRLSRLLNLPVTVTSKVDSGSIFSIEIPRAECSRPLG